LIGKLAIPFISAAVWMRAFWFLSIWNAWPTPKKNSENTSAAPIESKAEFLYMIHLRMVAYREHFLAMLNSNHHAS
jgi:hypothetical protein